MPDYIVCNGNTPQPKELFADRLVHRQQASPQAISGVRDLHPVQEALNSTILAPRPVKRVEDDLNPLGAQALRQVVPRVDLDRVVPA
jgi:hypothetical protein